MIKGKLKVINRKKKLKKILLKIEKIIKTHKLGWKACRIGERCWWGFGWWGIRIQRKRIKENFEDFKCKYRENSKGQRHKSINFTLNNYWFYFSKLFLFKKIERMQSELQFLENN
jgi:hypothetical protein